MTGHTNFLQEVSLPTQHIAAFLSFSFLKLHNVLFEVDNVFQHLTQNSRSKALTQERLKQHRRIKRAFRETPKPKQDKKGGTRQSLIQLTTVSERLQRTE